MSIGLQIRLARVQRNLTMKALAKQVGITPEYLSQIEHNKAPGFSVKLLGRLCRALDVSPNEILQWDQEPTHQI